MLELSILVRTGTAMDGPMFRSDRLGIQSSTSTSHLAQMVTARCRNLKLMGSYDFKGGSTVVQVQVLPEFLGFFGPS